MWDLKIDTRRLVEGFSTSVLWERPNILWNKADDWWNDNYVTDPSTAAFLSATGIIDPNKQNYVNNLVIALKNQGLWNKMKAVYPFVSEQRNLLNNTDTFSGWSLEGGTLTGGFTDPQGGTTAYKYTHPGTQGLWANQSFTLAATTYTQSIWVKSVSGTNTTFELSSGNGNTGRITLTATSTWQRVSNTTFFDIGGSMYIFNISNPAGIYVWHPQMELGNLTDYQVTINAQEQFAAAYKYNLKDPQDTDAAFRLKIFGTWTFTPTGALPNGTNAYMDTMLTPSVSLLQNSSHISAYSRTDSFSGAIMGCFDNGAANGLYTNPKFGGGTQESRNNSGDGGNVSNTNSTGLWLNNRISSTQYKIFRNNVTNQTSNTVSTGLCSISAYMGGLNRFGLTPEYQNREIACGSIGEGLTDAEAATFYTIVQQFQTSLNRQINP
jgi:hypothetical protein